MEVKMDINELRALENQITVLTAEKTELLAREKQVVIYHKYFNGTLKVVPGGKPGEGINITGVRPVVKRIDLYRSYDLGRAQFSMDLDIGTALQKGWVTIDLTEDSSKHTKDYANMSEVIKDIHAEEFLKAKEELDSAQLRASVAEHLVTTIEDKYTKEIITIRESHKELVEGMLKDHDLAIKKRDESYKNMLRIKEDAYTCLYNEFQDFKADKKRLTLEQQLAEALKVISDMNTRPWYRRLFS